MASILELLLQNDRLFLDYVTLGFFIFAISSSSILLWCPAPYGRYSSRSWGWTINAKTSWFIQESPCVLVPICLLIYTDCPRSSFWPNKILTALFFLHYFHRTCIFPFLIRGGKPSTIMTTFLAILFCTFNGYQQTRYLLKYAIYPPDWIFSFRFIAGCLLFCIGMAINIHSDHILRNLRKPNEKGYKIPKGGLFDYVSAANYFGEILEWFGYALASWSLPAAVFAFSTFCIIGIRGYSHHHSGIQHFGCLLAIHGYSFKTLRREVPIVVIVRNVLNLRPIYYLKMTIRFYLKKFENYPPERKAVIPFIL